MKVFFAALLYLLTFIDSYCQTTSFDCNLRDKINEDVKILTMHWCSSVNAVLNDPNLWKKQIDLSFFADTSLACVNRHQLTQDDGTKTYNSQTPMDFLNNVYSQIESNDIQNLSKAKIQCDKIDTIGIIVGKNNHFVKVFFVMNYFLTKNKYSFENTLTAKIVFEGKKMTLKITDIEKSGTPINEKQRVNCNNDGEVVPVKRLSETQIKALKESSTQKLQVKFRSFLERIAAQNLETSEREKIFQNLSKDVFLNQNISLFDENDNKSMTLEGYFSEKFVNIYCPNNAILRITGTLPSVFSEDISFKEMNFPVTAEVVWHFTFDVFNPTLGGRANENYSLKLNLKYLENNNVEITSIRVLKSIAVEDLSKLVGELLIVFDKLKYEWENEHKVLTADVAELNDLLQKIKLNLSPESLKHNPKLVASIENITKFLAEITKKPEEEKEEDLFEERRNFLASKGWITLKDVQIKFEDLGTANVITETEKQEVNQVYRKLISNLQALKNATNELNFSEMKILNELINELENELKIINR